LASRDGRGLYGFHPRLGELHRLYGEGKLAVVLNVGPLVRPLTRAEYQSRAAQVPMNLFSHSDQQAHWQSALPAGFATAGWAGLLADQMQSCNPPGAFPAVTSLSGNVLFGAGRQTTPAIVTAGVRMGLQGFSSRLDPRYVAFQQLLRFDNGSALVQAANAITTQGISNADLLNSALSDPSRLSVRFPGTSIGQQLGQVARIIEARGSLGLQRQIFFCSMGGYDTHNGQLPAHDNLLSQLSPAVAAFYDATAEMGVADRVTLFTESDFGRTCQPSAGNGSDHGWGGHHIVLGDAVRGGEVYGRYPELALGGPDDTASRGVYIPTLSIDQYAATLAAWFGVQETDLPAVFPNLPNFSPGTLPFLPRPAYQPARARG
jgi:uncharacterized protein (DUF1501 family)